jgi:putative polyketide hydroxylase
VAEVGALRRLLGEARDGAGSLLLVTGEAGIGKSRLLTELGQRARADGMVVLTGTATEGSPAYRPIAQALLHELRARPADDAPELRPYRAALGRLLPGWGGDDARLDDGVDPVLVLGEGVVRLLARIAGDAGCVVLLEDLHWADPDSLALLEYLSTALRSTNVLVAGSAREDPSGGLLRRLSASPSVTSIALGPLAVDRHRGTSVFPKATGIRLRTMEILRSWELADHLPEPSHDVRLAMAVSTTLAAERYQEVSLGIPSAAAVRAVSPAGFGFCAQDALEPVLLDHVRDRGGELRFGTEVTSLDISDDGVCAVLRPVRDGRDEHCSRVHATYVVGADGGSSIVRRAAGIGWRTLGFEGHHQAVLFRADLSRAVRDRSYVLHTTVAPGAEGRFVATGQHHRGVFDQERDPLSAAPRPEKLAADIRAASGLPDLDPEILEVFPWDFGAAAAESQRAGRAFLVGDAAHQTTPRGAVGMNAGIAEAHNLGWKLAWVLKGWADPGLLDSYDADRGPVGLRNALRSLEPANPDTQDRDLLADDIGVAYRSQVVASEGAEPHRTGVRPGLRAPHAWIEQDGRQRSMLDVYDGRLTVVTGAEGHVWRRGVDALAAPGRPVGMLTLGRDVPDPGGKVAASYGVGSTGAVLVRPDGHVAWGRPEGSFDASRLLHAAGEAALGVRRPGAAPPPGRGRCAVTQREADR